MTPNVMEQTQTSTLIEVRLTHHETLAACFVGLMRQIKSLARGSKDTYGFDADASDGWKVQMNGACAEQAFAKATDRHWDCSVDVFGRPDFAPNIDIKTRPSHDSLLIVRPDAHDEWKFVHVTGTPFRRHKIHGWIYGRDAKRPEWEGRPDPKRPPCFQVPSDALRSIEEIWENGR
jgi:hypothetical protein